MNQIIELDIALYGAFRDFGSAPVHLRVPAGIRVDAVKREFAAALSAGKDADTAAAINALLKSSVLSDDTQVLAVDSPIHRGGSFAILPPVCGG